MPSPELLGYTLLVPPPTYELNTTTSPSVTYKYRSRWSTSYTITDDDVPDGTTDCDMMVMFLQGTPTISSWGLSAEWQSAGKTTTPNSAFPIFAYYAQYSDTLFPTTLIPKDANGFVVTVAFGAWSGILLTYSEGHFYGGSGSYQAYNADIYLYGSPPGDAGPGPNFVDGVKVGAAITDSASGSLTLAVPSGFTERYNRPSDNRRYNANRGAKRYGNLLWVHDRVGFFAIDIAAWEWEYASLAPAPDSPGFVGAGTRAFDYDPFSQFVYRGTQASSGGGGSLPNRVEVWDTTTSPATRLYGIDQTRIPIAALVVPPVAATSTPKSVFFLFYTITSGATGPTLIRYDAATMSVLNTYTPAITIDDNNANLYYDEISDPPPPPPTPPPPPIPYLFVQGPYAVLKINLNTNTVVQTYVSPRGATINGSAYYNQTIWLTTAGATVRRVNADTMTEVASVSTSGTFQANSICAGPNGVNFCIQNNGFHARHINPATNTITASTPVDNFTRFAVDGDTQFFVMNQDDRLWRMDATTTARTDPSLFTTVFNVVTPFSVIDAQTSSTVGYAPRWSKPVYGPYGAARFVSLNGLEICEDEGWHLGIMGI